MSALRTIPAITIAQPWASAAIFDVYKMGLRLPSLLFEWFLWNKPFFLFQEFLKNAKDFFENFIETSDILSDHSAIFSKFSCQNEFHRIQRKSERLFFDLLFFLLVFYINHLFLQKSLNFIFLNLTQNLILSSYFLYCKVALYTWFFIFPQIDGMEA